MKDICEMGKHVWLFFCLGLLFVGLSTSVKAMDPQLSITGEVKASSCEVNADETVRIGTFAGSDFPSIGSTSAFKAFNITLTKCYAGLSSVQVTFSGTSDVDNPALLAINEGAGMATGLGVEVLDTNGNPILIDENTPQDYDLEEDTTTLSFLLRYKATRYPVTSGEAMAVMYFDLAYQ